MSIDVIQKGENNLCNKCYFCLSNSIVFDPDTAENICGSCGVVLGHQEIDGLMAGVNSDDSTTSIRHGSSSLAHHTNRLSTFISYSNADANGVIFSTVQRSRIFRMRKWNEISNYNRSYHRNMKNAFAILLRIKDKLGLSQTVVERAAYYYRKVVDLHIIKGRSIKGFIVSCVYVACREMNIPRSLAEISDVSGCNKKFTAKCFRLLLSAITIRLPAVDCGSHMAKIANNAGISERTLRRGIDMMATFKTNPLSYGKDPNALAAAILYGACLANRERISRTQIAYAANTSLVTLRNRLLDVKIAFPALLIHPNYECI